MTAIGPDTILLTFLIFCRIGACLMLMPGFSSSRVPVQIRLFLAIAITLAMTPLVLPKLPPTLGNPGAPMLMAYIVSETTTGAMIGLLGRFFFLALQFMGTAIAMFMGYQNTPDAAIEEAEPAPAVASLITITATVLIFVTDMHWEIFRALLDSYGALPVTERFPVQDGLAKLSDALGDAFYLALKISAPFVIYSLLVNFMFGIVNKLTPQVPVYFISMPFVLAGGLILLYFAFSEFVRLFLTEFSSWLIAG